MLVQSHVANGWRSWAYLPPETRLIRRAIRALILSTPHTTQAQLGQPRPPYLERVPLLKPSSSLSVAWKLYRATDSIPSQAPAAGLLAGPAASLLPPQLRTSFLCFESVFVLFEAETETSLTEKQEADVPDRRCEPQAPSSDLWASPPAALGVGPPSCTHLLQMIKPSLHSSKDVELVVAATPTHLIIHPPQFLNSDAPCDPLLTRLLGPTTRAFLLLPPHPTSRLILCYSPSL